MRIPVKVYDKNNEPETRPRWREPLDNMDIPEGSDEMDEKEMTEREFETGSASDAESRARAVSRDDIGSEYAAEPEWKDKYVRLLADFENYKRHANAERERLSGVGREMVLEDVFPVVEHMERAIAAARESGEQNGILAGVEMVYREFLGVLEKHGVSRVPTVGEPFDPAMHEAVSMAPGTGEAGGTVIAEVRPGFMRSGKLLRPASVVVAQD